jgi:hypothetical protein
VLVLRLLVLLLWPGTHWWVEHVDGVKIHGKGGLTGKDRQGALDNARGRITAIATGLLAAFAIYYTANNAASARRTAQAAQAAQDGVDAARRSARQSEEAQRRTHELTERGQLTDRFTAAVAQLGDASPAVQLGGVHALAGIADDAPTRTLRQTCIDVLCAYLRLPHDPRTRATCRRLGSWTHRRAETRADAAPLKHRRPGPLQLHRLHLGLRPLRDPDAVELNDEDGQE